MNNHNQKNNYKNILQIDPTNVLKIILFKNILHTKLQKCLEIQHNNPFIIKKNLICTFNKFIINL